VSIFSAGQKTTFFRVSELLNCSKTRKIESQIYLVVFVAELEFIAPPEVFVFTPAVLVFIADVFAAFVLVLAPAVGGVMPSG
jgi:hypothetical protein